MLSQFAGESEVLFPPCIMLAVSKRPKGEVAAARPAQLQHIGGVEDLDVNEREEGGKRFLALGVVPSFV